LVKDADNEHVQSVYNFTSYRKFIAAWITSRPLGGKGERLKLARAARIHPSLITQILNGNKELTSEQAFLLSQHCGLQGAEREYFQDLVQWERAGDPQYKAWLGDKLKGMRSKGRPEIDAGDLAPLSEYERAIFYSAWYYSAIHLATALPGRWDVDRVTSRFGLPRATVQDVLNFLTSTGLCTSDGGRYRMGMRRTHIQDVSTHLDRFLTNWRLKGIERIPSSRPSEFFHSQQLYLSKADVVHIKALLIRITEEVGKTMEKGTPETVFCLNLDWFET